MRLFTAVKYFFIIWYVKISFCARLFEKSSAVKMLCKDEGKSLESDSLFFRIEGEDVFVCAFLGDVEEETVCWDK
jgi:hypothetical protein